MKKIITLAIIALLCINVKAQLSELDERDLIGTWTGTTTKGDFSNISSRWYQKHILKEIEIKPGCSGRFVFDDDNIFPGGGTPFSSFFISNGNKLNVFYSGGTIDKFVITEYVKGESITLTDMADIVEVVLRKEEASSVRVTQIEAYKDSTMYSLHGIKTNHPQGVYIQSGKKLIKY
ncbi:MAG: hypothetical protein IJ551_06045 [Prevotella sp.]|nr:hypothetical protein [Prevotella sp.]